MPKPPSDQAPIEPPTEHLREDELLRRFCRHRDRGDAASAHATWQQLAVRNFDRVKQAVKLFRFPGGAPIAAADVDDAVQEAYLRVVAMGANFSGTAIDQFRAALRTCVQNSCLDFGRKELRHARHAGGSLDETFDDATGSPYDAAIARRSQELQALAEEALDDARRLEAAADLVAWGIAQIENDGYRAVLELTFIDPTPGEEIAARLGITPDNVYQRRRRGLKQLEAILRDHQA